MQLIMVGKFRDTLTWQSHTGTKRTEERGWSFNQIQDSALHLVTGSIIGVEDTNYVLFNNFAPIRYLAIGSGEPSWDANPNNVSKPVTQTNLTTEFTRFAVTADEFEFLDDSGALLSPQSLSPRFRLTRLLGANDANGDLREFGLFGGNASADPNTGVMFNWITHPLIQKDTTLIIERVIDIQFSINRS
jgi:hypothetical protein